MSLQIDLSNTPLFRHSRAGCSRGFAQHAVRLRNDGLMQKSMRPARGNPGNTHAPLGWLKSPFLKFHPDWILAYARMTEVGGE